MMQRDLYYIERGKGPPVVLLHGFPLDGRVWAGPLELLSSTRRVIVPDLPGFGKSPTRGSFTIESLAEDLHALLMRIGALPCVLAGLSMGGYVSQSFAAKFADDLRGLILVDTRSSADTDQGKQSRNDMIELAKTKGSAAVAEQMMPRMLGPTASRELSDQLSEIMNDCPAQTIEHACAAMRDRPDFSAMLANLKLPALIIVGQSDALTPPAVAEAIHGSIPGSALSIIPNAGHMTPMEQPAEVAAAIRKFLAIIPGYA
ncbi:MAG: alpha/beta fold hydrolase [Tepidisphaeraceae bacterium]|jgi:pimeloyl-ACP methyl ester carboxylesterase